MDRRHFITRCGMGGLGLALAS
ncbi:MAG: twin-arginine translocation signal domain-containing protein, partial [Nodosilinea sp.]